MSKDVFSKGMLKNHSAIVGMTGSGKTSTAKLLVEHVVAENARVCIIDPTKSDWWGLTSSASGKRAGLPFTILGGPHGHVPLHRSSGAAVGELVATRKLPLSIIDMADFGMGDHQEFFIRFSEALLKKNKGVVYLVIEEAHEFAPKEKSKVSGESMAIYWAKKLATAGRSKGIRLVVVSQRTQALHNSLLGSCRTLIAHQLNLPADQEPVIKWIKGNLKKDDQERITESLAFLKTGQGWLCDTVDHVTELKQFPRIATYDNSATPEDDADRGEVKTAAVDQDQLRSIIGDAVKEAVANDPATLKKTIATLTAEKATLERKLANPPTITKPVADKDALEAAYQRGRDEMGLLGLKAMKDTVAEWEADIVKIRAAAATVEQAAKSSEGLIAKFKRAFDKTEKRFNLSGLPSVTSAPIRVTHVAAPVRAAPAAASPRTPTSPAGSGDGPLPPGEHAILTVVMQYGGVDRDQLSVLTGYKRSSRDAYVQRLSTKGLVSVSGSQILPTDITLAALGDSYEPFPVGAALQEFWLKKLPDGEGKILNVLLSAGGTVVTREQLDAETGYKRSSRDAYIQRLKARRLVEVEREGVRASQTLF